MRVREFAVPVARNVIDPDTGAPNVPEITPVDVSSESPVGIVPEATDQTAVTGSTTPDPVKPAVVGEYENEVPTVDVPDGAFDVIAAIITLPSAAFAVWVETMFVAEPSVNDEPPPPPPAPP